MGMWGRKWGSPGAGLPPTLHLPQACAFLTKLHVRKTGMGCGQAQGRAAATPTWPLLSPGQRPVLFWRCPGFWDTSSVQCRD